MRVVLTTLSLMTCAIILTACALLTDIPAVREAETVRVLCAKNKGGEYMFGPLTWAAGDTDETIIGIKKKNAAWLAATKDGTLCDAN